MTPIQDFNPLGMTRAEKWHYVIESLLGGLDDTGIVHWLGHLDPTEADVDRLFAEAVKLRDGMVAT